MPRPLRLFTFALVATLTACGAADDGAGQGAPSGVTGDDAGVTPGSNADAGAGDDASPGKPPVPACSATDPRATPVVLSVLPDQGEQPFVDLLQSAQKSIRVLGYQMGYGGVLDTLQAKAKAGIDVHVILDGQTQLDVNDKYRVMLEGAGAKFEWSDPEFAYMHAKVLIVDDKEAIVSTSNYSLSFIKKERNFLAHITDPQDVSDLVKLFDADWARKAPDLTCTRLLVSPVNARDRLVALIKSAKHTILVESMQFSDTAVKQALIDQKAAGLDVEVILAAPSWISTNTDAAKDLMAAQIPTRWMSSPAVHVKAMVIDGAYAYLGSENVSYTSLSKNREVGVIVSDAPVVTTMASTFQTDWGTATSF